MFASMALSTAPTNSSSTAEQHDVVGTSQNYTAVATSSPVDDGDDSERAADSGELTGAGDRGEDDGGGGSADGSTAAGGRVAELYEDLEDSVVFEDSDGHSDGGGRSAADDFAADDHQPPLTDDAAPRAAAVGESSASAEEYDTAVDDASPAGNSPVGHVLQRSVKYPEYVRSSSYRRGWSGGNVTRPEDVFRFWDAYEWTATPAVSPRCVDQMQLYQAALRNGKMWAFKSE